VLHGPAGSGAAEFGIAFQTDKPPGGYAPLAVAAEAYGFDVVSVFADLLYQPPLPALLEMAAVTSRVRLGTACLNPYTLHPYEIDAASGGRGYLGLARGAWLDAVGVAQSRPLTRLREAAAVARALLSGDDTGFAGEVFRLAPGTRLRYPLPSRVPPLLLGAWGPRGTALAGEIADELKVGGTASPAVVRQARRRAAAASLAVGRPPVGVRIVAGAVTVVAEDGPAARRRARSEVAMYLAVVGALDTTGELPGDLLTRIAGLLRAGGAAEAGALIPDEVLRRFAFCGTPEQVAEQASAVLKAGAGRVDFGTPHGLTSAEGVRLLGTRVLPLLRG
jgi:5,10-methylenetetrahydromethanopterin reductase